MRTLDGRYRLERRIGSGGMAVVWLGHDTVLSRPVAVKLLDPQRSHDSASRALVRAEAQAAAQLAHPNVASVYDFGHARVGLLRRVSYIVMELLDGETLASRLRSGPLEWFTAAQVCADVAAGLSAAHARGIVHRDVKPANVMLTATGVKVVDFGIAAAVGQSEAHSDGPLLGTPAYLAPERLRGEVAVPGTDVYGLGLLLYHCLTGRLPWATGSAADLIEAHLDAEPQPLPPVPGMPAEVAELCLRCLRKHPGERPAARHVSLVLARVAGTRVSVPTRISLRSAAVPHRDREVAVGTLVARSEVPPVARSEVLPVTRSEVPQPAGSAAGARASRILRPAAVAGAVVAGMLAMAVTEMPGQRAADAPEAEAAPSAGSAGGGAGGGPVCVVSYAARADPGDRFTATLRVSSTAGNLPEDWTLAFALPPQQRVVGARGARWTQVGREVTLQGPWPQPAGSGLTITLVGTGGGDGRGPASFALNGSVCVPTTSRQAAAAVGEGADVQQLPTRRPATDTQPLPAAGPAGTDPAGTDPGGTDPAGTDPGGTDPGGRQATPTLTPAPTPTPGVSSPAGTGVPPSSAPPDSPSPSTPTRGGTPTAGNPPPGQDTPTGRPTTTRTPGTTPPGGRSGASRPVPAPSTGRWAL